MPIIVEFLRYRSISKYAKKDMSSKADKRGRTPSQGWHVKSLCLSHKVPWKTGSYV